MLSLQGRNLDVCDVDSEADVDLVTRALGFPLRLNAVLVQPTNIVRLGEKLRDVAELSFEEMIVSTELAECIGKLCFLLSELESHPDRKHAYLCGGIHGVLAVCVPLTVCACLWFCVCVSASVWRPFRPRV